MEKYYINAGPIGTRARDAPYAPWLTTVALAHSFMEDCRATLGACKAGRFAFELKLLVKIPGVLILESCRRPLQISALAYGVLETNRRILALQMDIININAFNLPA